MVVGSLQTEADSHPLLLQSLGKREEEMVKVLQCYFRIAEIEFVSIQSNVQYVLTYHSPGLAVVVVGNTGSGIQGQQEGEAPAINE